MEYFDGICMICHNIKQVRHINIYPVGSEGLFICKVCEFEILLPYIKNVMRENIKLKKEKFKQKRRFYMAYTKKERNLLKRALEEDVEILLEEFEEKTAEAIEFITIKRIKYNPKTSGEKSIEYLVTVKR